MQSLAQSSLMQLPVVTDIVINRAVAVNSTGGVITDSVTTRCDTVIDSMFTDASVTDEAITNFTITDMSSLTGYSHH